MHTYFILHNQKCRHQWFRMDKNLYSNYCGAHKAFSIDKVYNACELKKVHVHVEYRGTFLYKTRHKITFIKRFN